MKDKKEWVEDLAKENPHLETQDLEFIWKLEETKRLAQKWAKEGISYIPYISKEYRLRLAQYICLSLAEEMEEFYPIFEKIAELRESECNTEMVRNGLDGLKSCGFIQDWKSPIKKVDRTRYVVMVRPARPAQHMWYSWEFDIEDLEKML